MLQRFSVFVQIPAVYPDLPLTQLVAVSLHTFVFRFIELTDILSLSLSSNKHQ